MFYNHLKIAYRSLLKNRVTGFINIAGLAMGMAVAIMIGLWVHDEMTYNSVHPDYERIGQLYVEQSVQDKYYTGISIAQPSAPALRDQYGSNFEGVAMASWNYAHLLGNGTERFNRDGMHVEPDFLSIFSYDMIHGDLKNALKEPDAIVISESLAEAFFGEENPMGKTLRIDSREDLVVTGVFEDLPSNSRMKSADFFVTWDHYLKHNTWAQESTTRWDNHSYQLFAKIKPNVDFAELNEKIKDIEKEHNPAANPQLFLYPMPKWHLYSDFENGENVGGRIQTVRLFGIIGVFVLLLACINFMNLSTARSEKRAKEVGIRKTIGSMRGQLIGQFLSESLLVAFLAMLIAVSLVQITIDPFNVLAFKSIKMPWGQPAFWISILSFTLFTGLLAGSYPAFYLSSFKPIQVLKNKMQAGRWSSLPRQFLVTLQFTVSVALIIGTIVVFQQIDHAKHRPVGFEKNGLINFMSSVTMYDKAEVFMDEVRRTGVAEEVSYSSSPVTNVWSNNSSFEWEGKDPEELVSFGVVGCSHEFGKTINWEILEGRDFSVEFSTDTASLILNESAVAQIGIPAEELIGQTIRWNKTPNTVVGVIKDMVMDSPYSPPKPTIFFVNPNWLSVYNVRFKEGIALNDGLEKVEAAWKKHDAETPFDYSFVDDDYNEKFASEERIGNLARIFAILAIIISCLGLFGLSAYIAEQRTKEIGIRKVLGASVTSLWSLQSKSFVALVILACFIATPIAWYYLDGWLEDYEYRIDLNWTVFVASAILALVVTLVTVSFQSIKAALANPVESLRSE